MLRFVIGLAWTVLLAAVVSAAPYSHEMIGLDVAIANNLFGSGQTIAVIDSGLALDHYAFTDRVQTGYDFTESDDVPYDDPTSGRHGTHVAGIAVGGITSSAWHGVAPEADIVSLRVFDDNGAGYFMWVEQSLQWVHDNRDAFEHPITAVNLSLGTTWNSDTVPMWGMLEEELAQLEADGIFTVASAGNSFPAFDTPGLSYPASSPHVVPVMSVDSSGSLSTFSQRHTRAIAAPGRGITSTLPDYAGNNNGVADDYGSMTGTSQAAPYVAGASMLVREALQRIGTENIDQWMINDYLRASAVDVYDPITMQTYLRMDLGATLEAILPTGDFNLDGIVDAADYVSWRKLDGGPVNLGAWRENFGTVIEAPGSVPEPPVVLYLLGLLLLGFRRDNCLRRSTCLTRSKCPSGT